MTTLFASTSCFLRLWLLRLLTQRAVFSRIGAAAEHTQGVCSSSADTSPVASDSLLQARAKHLGKVSSSEFPVAGIPNGAETCSLQSPWMSNMSPRNDMTFENYQDNPCNCSQGLFVFPPRKFAICLIEKNACTTWISKVLQPLMMNGSHPNCTDADSNEDCVSGLNYNIAQDSQQHFGQEGIERIFQDPDAIRAVFVRDPLARFASAFLNKCGVIADPLFYNCIIPEHVPAGERSMKYALEFALTLNMSWLNPHWKPQADHCDLRNRIQGYNVVSLVSKETFEADMNCVLTKAGLHEFISPEHVQPWATTNSSNAITVLQKLFTPEAARKLINHLSIDYDVLGFSKEPEWLAGATGEWYNKVPHGNGTDQKFAFVDTQRNSSYRREVYEETDDLVELAYRAGYIR